MSAADTSPSLCLLADPGAFPCVPVWLGVSACSWKLSNKLCCQWKPSSDLLVVLDVY